MIHGTRPTFLKHTDYDFLKSRKFKGISAPQFPPEYFCDAGLTMPNQNADGEPYGCTNYSQAELANDLNKTVHSPADLEEVTHANTKGGYDIRDSLDAARKTLGWFTAFFNIRAYAPLDYFDAFRLAQMSGIPEKRSITWGTPWFPSWEQAATGTTSTKNLDGTYRLEGGHDKQYIMPMPTDAELSLIRKDPFAIPWHNSKLDGWTTRNGVILYRDKSWQGTDVGEGGYIYFTRDVINVVMAIKGTVGFTASNMKPDSIETIDLSLFEKFISFIRTFFNFRY